MGKFGIRICSDGVLSFPDIQSFVTGSCRRAEHEGSGMASGSGTQFGKIVRPVQGAGLLAERGAESRGRPPRQVSPLSLSLSSFLWRRRRRRKTKKSSFRASVQGKQRTIGCGCVRLHELQQHLRRTWSGVGQVCYEEIPRRQDWIPAGSIASKVITAVHDVTRLCWRWDDKANFIAS